MSLTDLRMWGECQSSGTGDCWACGQEGRGGRAKRFENAIMPTFLQIKSSLEMCQAVSMWQVLLEETRVKEKNKIWTWDDNLSITNLNVLCCMNVYIYDILPGLKCHSCSSEDDTSATRTITTAAGNSRREGRAMTAATHLVTCLETHRWSQAYLSQKKSYLGLHPLQDPCVCMLELHQHPSNHK